MSAIADRGYVHPDVLVSTDWVADHLNDPKVRIVESNEDTLLYASGHVPGAAHVDWTADLNDQIRRDYISKDGFEALAVETRADAGHHRRLLRRQEQLVGLLRVLGVPAVRPRQHRGDGRRPRQVGEGRTPADARRRRRIAATQYRSTKRNDAPHRAFRDEVLHFVESKGQLVDVRSPDEYSGKKLHMPEYPNEGALRGGHIPGAKSVPWAKAINPEDGTFKTADELKAIYLKSKRWQIRTKPIIAYCRIGERSSHTWFALQVLLGFKNIRNYDGSWTELGAIWSTSLSRSSGLEGWTHLAAGARRRQTGSNKSIVVASIRRKLDRSARRRSRCSPDQVGARAACLIGLSRSVQDRCRPRSRRIQRTTSRT